jgi:hypothetical protein
VRGKNVKEKRNICTSKSMDVHLVFPYLSAPRLLFKGNPIKLVAPQSVKSWRSLVRFICKQTLLTIKRLWVQISSHPKHATCK